MTGADWVPENVLERDLLRFRQNGDGEAYARRLARADLLLPLLPEEAAGGVPVSWVTSAAPMHRLLADEAPHRVARFVELAETWPDPVVRLAVDPGLPIEAFLTR